MQEELDLNVFVQTLKCPLTSKFFKTPVIGPNGITYERSVIFQHYIQDTLPFPILDYDKTDKVNRTETTFNVLFHLTKIIEQQIEIYLKTYPEKTIEQYVELEVVNAETIKKICNNLNESFDILLKFTDFDLLTECYEKKSTSKKIIFIKYLLKHCKNNDIIIHCINNSKIIKKTKKFKKIFCATHVRDYDCSFCNKFRNCNTCRSCKICSSELNTPFHKELYHIFKSNNFVIIKYVMSNFIITYEDYYFPPNTKYFDTTTAEIICSCCNYEIISYCFNVNNNFFCLQNALPHDKCDHPITRIMINSLVSDDDKLNFVKLFVECCKKNPEILTTFYRSQSVIINMVYRILPYFDILEYLYLSQETQFLWDYKTEQNNISIKYSIINLIYGYIPQNIPSDKFIGFLVKVFNKLTENELKYLTTETELLSHVIAYCSDTLVLKLLTKDNSDQIKKGWSFCTLLIQHKPHLVSSCQHLFNDLCLSNYNGIVPASLCIFRNIDNITHKTTKKQFKETVTYKIFKRTKMHQLTKKSISVLIKKIKNAKFLNEQIVKKICKLMNGCYFANYLDGNLRILLEIVLPTTQINKSIINKFLQTKAYEFGIVFPTYKNKNGITILHFSLIFIFYYGEIDEITNFTYLDYLDYLIKNGHDILARNNYGHDLLDMCTILLKQSDRVKKLAKNLNETYFNNRQSFIMADSYFTIKQYMFGDNVDSIKFKTECTNIF